MRRKFGTVLMLLGLLMIFSAAGLLLHNSNQAQAAGESAELALNELQKEITYNEEAAPEPAEVLPLMEKEPQLLESAELDGYGYIGYLSIPSLGLELPVMDSWDYTRLRIAPCREKGETAENLIIAGHNYPQHFGQLHSVAEGELISFTDMSGNITEYTVESVETVGPYERDRVEDEKWNLVLYTCTYDGRQRIMLACTVNNSI